MPAFRPDHGIQRAFAGVLIVMACLVSLQSLSAQYIPTVQQNEFRSQWIGEQVDQLADGPGAPPTTGLGALVGSLQTQDEVQREVEASLAAVKTKSPFSFKPAFGVGWQINNQGELSTNQPSQNGGSGGTTYKPGSSTFVAPSVAFLYDREHGPWEVSAGYSVGYQYFFNPNFVGAGTAGSGGQRNPINQTALFKAALSMSRYIMSFLVSASQGTGYSITSGSNTQQVNLNASTEMKYTLTEFSSVDAKAAYTYQNSSQSASTPNNNITSLITDLAPVYDLSDKTHLSWDFGAGQSAQSLPGGASVPGNTTTSGNVNNARNYAQSLGTVKWDATGKTTLNLSLGARYVTTTGITNSIDNGFKPSWSFGIGYTPTPKTSVTLSFGEEGANIKPSLNFMLNWNPREKTQFSLGVSQTQSFSGVVASQYQVSQNIVATMKQKLFTSVDLSLSGGYTAQQYVNLSATTTPGQSTSQLPSSYYLGQLSVIWKIRDWVNLNNSLYISTGQSQQSGNGSSSSTPQAWYSISLNFAL